MLTEQLLARLIAGLHEPGRHSTDTETNLAVLTGAAKLARTMLGPNGKQADIIGARWPAWGFLNQLN